LVWLFCFATFVVQNLPARGDKTEENKEAALFLRNFYLKRSFGVANYHPSSNLVIFLSHVGKKCIYAPNHIVTMFRHRSLSLQQLHTD
jgi:hypothetical protein